MCLPSPRVTTDKRTWPFSPGDAQQAICQSGLPFLFGGSDAKTLGKRLPSFLTLDYSSHTNIIKHPTTCYCLMSKKSTRSSSWRGLYEDSLKTPEVETVENVSQSSDTDQRGGEGRGGGEEEVRAASDYPTKWKAVLLMGSALFPFTIVSDQRQRNWTSYDPLTEYIHDQASLDHTIIGKSRYNRFVNSYTHLLITVITWQQPSYLSSSQNSNSPPTLAGMNRPIFCPLPCSCPPWASATPCGR